MIAALSAADMSSMVGCAMIAPRMRGQSKRKSTLSSWVCWKGISVSNAELIKNALAVLLQDGRIVLLSKLNDEPHDYVDRVIWKDGTWSWAKSWAVWDEAAQVWKHSRVGAGANGNLIVWEE